MPKRYARLPLKIYSKWGQPELVNGKWEIRRTYTRKGRSGIQGVDIYRLTKKR